LSLDSASRISSAAETSGEAIALAKKALEEELNSRQVRELTRLLNEKADSEQRQRLIRESWQVTEVSLAPGRRDHAKNRTDSSSHEAFSVLVHRKLLWNLRRLKTETFDHFTIGYSKRTLHQFIELIRLAGVDLVADVRYTAISRFRPDFSISNLSSSLAEHGIDYRHWPELGIPPHVRRSFQSTADLKGLFTWYDSSIQPELKVAKYSTELATQRIAFMCVEFDPQSCHRHRIAACLEQEGLALLDL
jgi:hypothetical protein